ncbi:hypothetical protein FJW05_21470 [Mesorhizobium sp. B2-9-1]|nr:hypothetical protein FJW05_21470 [Mesorhizobium sp. B2-9-1]
MFCARGISLIMRCCRHENLQRAEETKVGSHVVRDGWTEGVQGALTRPSAGQQAGARPRITQLR